MCSVFLTFTFLQVVSLFVPEASSASSLPFLPTDEGIHVSDVISRRLLISEGGTVRRPRNVMSLLSLLWPQVVGPIDNGIIKDENFESVPKTPMEIRLDEIREHSRQELKARQHVRDMLNAGVPPEQVGLQQLHTLHDDFGLFFGHHPSQEIHINPHVHHQVMPLQENHVNPQVQYPVVPFSVYDYVIPPQAPVHVMIQPHENSNNESPIFGVNAIPDNNFHPILMSHPGQDFISQMHTNLLQHHPISKMNMGNSLYPSPQEIMSQILGNSFHLSNPHLSPHFMSKQIMGAPEPKQLGPAPEVNSSPTDTKNLPQGPSSYLLPNDHFMIPKTVESPKEPTADEPKWESLSDLFMAALPTKI